jgi:hypothetical protein
VTCVGSFLLAIWINSVALKWADYPLLGYYIDGRDQIATAQDGYICYGGEET